MKYRKMYYKIIRDGVTQRNNMKQRLIMAIQCSRIFSTLVYVYFVYFDTIQFRFYRIESNIGFAK